MEKTKCLYDKLPYETEFDANVLAVKALEEAQDRYEVILDQTLFFTEQGDRTRIRHGCLLDTDCARRSGARSRMCRFGTV